MESWQFYVVMGLVLCAMEMFVLGFVLLPIGLAFFLTAVVAALLAPGLVVELIVLAVTSLLMLFAFKKYSIKKTSSNLKTNVDSLVGKSAHVTEEIDNDREVGYVKVFGDSWRAISHDGSVISVGASVTIRSVDGNKIVVAVKS